MPSKTGPLFLPLLRVFFDQASTWRLLVFTIIGYAFSLSVILSTLGLMDGFSSTLKDGLRQSAGDAIIGHQGGFFKLNEVALEELQLAGVRSVAQVLQTEAFLLSEGQSQGVLVRAVESADMRATTGLPLELSLGEIAIGKTLADDWRLKPGDFASLVLATGRDGDLPQIIPLTVKQVITHGIHEKDARFVYVTLAQLRETLKIPTKINMALVSFGGEHRDVQAVQAKVEELRAVLGRPWTVKPAWQEFAGLLEAVEIEKTSIAVVLQLIVLVAVFNVAAFLITLQSRKSREFFLLNALGMPRSRFVRLAVLVLLGLWILSCAGALVFVQLFNFLLTHAPWLRVPGDVYVLTQLQVLLSFTDYLVVFGLALLWMLVLGALALRKMRRQSLLTGLRQEFQ
ncbi:MAG: ABC transporter permease [Bacteriovoracia bacterium]